MGSGLRKHNFKDITGQTFGRLTASTYLGDCYWQCLCVCGTTTRVNSTKLRRGSVVSCGCFMRETNARIQKLLHTKHGMHESPEYATWAAMHARCKNSNHKEWRNYGGRRVKVCEEWSDFALFFRDMGPRPSSRHSLDRTDNGLLYSKATCRWATGIEQHNNTRRNHLLTYEGRTQTDRRRGWR